MSNNIRVLELLEGLKIKEFELDNLVFGSIEVRNRDSKKYIYCHTRENGLQVTKYVGEYSDVLFEMIQENNDASKILKKDIKRMEIELRKLGYQDGSISKEVGINIDFAKRHMADTIYTQAILEGVATTLSDTENIIEGGIVNNMSVDDIMKVVNLKHAWEFILNKNVITTPTNYSILCTINKLVEEGFYYSAGLLRSTPVKIGGTKWAPILPNEIDIIDNINKIMNKRKNKIDIGIELLLYIVRSQIFIDGNKRTSLIFANHYLIANGKGMIVIPVEKQEMYKKLLIDYYETNSIKKISNFIKSECYLDIIK